MELMISERVVDEIAATVQNRGASSPEVEDYLWFAGVFGG
jgi:hypothetical protein